MMQLATHYGKYSLKEAKLQTSGLASLRIIGFSDCLILKINIQLRYWYKVHADNVAWFSLNGS